MTDNLLRWEAMDMSSAVILYETALCDGDKISFSFNMLKAKVTELSYLGFPDIEDKVVS